MEATPVKTVFSGEYVSAFDKGQQGPAVTVYPRGASRVGHVSVIWSLTIDQARELAKELVEALAKIGGPLAVLLLLSLVACGEVDQASAGGRGGDAGAAATGGAGGGASTAPACRGSFVGAIGGVCSRVEGTSQQPQGWQCEIGCSSSAADNAAGCVFNGVTYCVSSCDACRP